MTEAMEDRYFFTNTAVRSSFINF